MEEEVKEGNEEKEGEEEEEKRKGERERERGWVNKKKILVPENKCLRPYRRTSRLSPLCVRRNLPSKH